MNEEGETMCALEREAACSPTPQPGGAVDVRRAPPSAALTAVSWTPPADLDLREWLVHGRRLGVLGRGVAWWIGDWLIYGNLRYGERYARASRVTGYDRQSLMNMAYVASRFSVERRRATLSWSHHAELAARPAHEQDLWLARAEADRMSVRSLRTELRSLQRRRAEPAALRRYAPEDDGAAPSVVCPRCHSVIELGGEHVRTSLALAAAARPT